MEKKCKVSIVGGSSIFLVRYQVWKSIRSRPWEGELWVWAAIIQSLRRVGEGMDWRDWQALLWDHWAAKGKHLRAKVIYVQWGPISTFLEPHSATSEQKKSNLTRVTVLLTSKRGEGTKARGGKRDEGMCREVVTMTDMEGYTGWGRQQASRGEELWPESNIRDLRVSSAGRAG